MTWLPTGFGHASPAVCSHLSATHPRGVRPHFCAVSDPGGLAVDVDHSGHPIAQMSRRPRSKSIHRQIEQIHVTIGRHDLVCHRIFPF